MCLCDLAVIFTSTIKHEPITVLLLTLFHIGFYLKDKFLNKYRHEQKNYWGRVSACQNI